MKTTIVYWGYIGVLLRLYSDNGNKMETSIVCWNMGIMENRMETTLCELHAVNFRPHLT